MTNTVEKQKSMNATSKEANRVSIGLAGVPVSPPNDNNIGTRPAATHIVMTNITMMEANNIFLYMRG